MKLLFFLLLPVMVRAQVLIDTVIQLPARVRNCIYLPSVNKLYIGSENCLVVVDRATYAVSTIPTGDDYNEPNCYSFAWNWRRDKLYVLPQAYDTILAIDVRADSIVSRIPWVGRAQAYASGRDCLYGTEWGNLVVIDCATDSIIKTIPPNPIDHSGSVWWDSVGNKVYTHGGYNYPHTEQAYSCYNDSLVAVFDPGVQYPIFMASCPEHRLTCYTDNSFGPARLPFLDTERDSVVRILSIEAIYEVALNRAQHKFYAIGEYVESHQIRDTIFAISCDGCSVVAKVPFPDFFASTLCWTPWSNRIYTVGWPDDDSTAQLRVIDCRMDSVIVGIDLPPFPRDVVADTVNQCVYVPCESDSCLYVFRDVPPGVVETLAAITPAVSFSVSPNPAEDHVTINASVPASVHAVLAVYDAAGRHVRTLDCAETEPRALQARWDCTDGRSRVAPGVYVIKLDAGTTHISRKVALTGR